MTITSIGYAGTIDEVNEAEWSRISVLGAEYSVGRGTDDAATVSDCKVSAVTGVDRTARVPAGALWGKGILDDNDANIDIPLAAVGAPGSRWDTIVARRNRTTQATTIIALQGTAARAISANRLVGWTESGSGPVDDQPLALARLDYNSTAIGELVDLRCWAGAGGLQVAKPEGLAYLTGPGSRVWVEGVEWVREVAANGTVSWQPARHLEVVDGAKYGTYAGQRVKWRIRRKVYTTDANAQVIIMNAADFSGILDAWVTPSPAATAAPDRLQIDTFVDGNSNLVGRLWGSTGLRPNTSFAAVANIQYW